MRALASFYASQRSKGRCTVANTFVFLPKGTIYIGTAKHSSVVKVLKLATSRIARLFKRVNKGSEAASIPSAEAGGFTQPLVTHADAIFLPSSPW